MQDQHFIYELFRQLGLSHAGLVQSLFYKILGIDKRFQAIDPNWSDVVHVGKMILIYAASHYQPEMLKDAPTFVYKSLDYLKDEFSQYFKPPSDIHLNEVKQAPLPGQVIFEKLVDPMLAHLTSLFKQGLFSQVLKLTKNSYTQLEKLRSSNQL